MSGTKYPVRIPPWARSHFEGKTRIWKSFEYEADGEAWVAKIKAKLKEIKAGGQAAAVGFDRARHLSFTAAQGLWLAEADIAESSRRWYTHVISGRLDPFFGEMKLALIGQLTILSYFEFRRASEKASTPDSLFKDLTVIRCILSWARDRGYTVDASAWSVAKPKVIKQVTRSFDREAVNTFLEAAKGMNRVIIEVALGTGMRRNELKAFDVSWIRWEQGCIRIPADQTFAPKDRAARSIPLYPRLETILKEWLAGRIEGPVFPPTRKGASGTGRAIGPDLRRIFIEVRTASKVNFRGWHDLRHYYISLLFHLNRPIPEIMAISGHSQMSTVAGYAHASGAYLKEVRSALAGLTVVAETVAAAKKGKKGSSRKSAPRA